MTTEESSFPEDLLPRKTETAPPIEPELPDWLRVTKKPFAVQALVCINTLVFAAMAGISGIRSLFIPSSQVLLHFGASSGASTIVDGEFWRIFSSAFVHIGFLHLMMNCYVIWDVGPLVEKLYGARKFITIYLGAALGAALTSLMIDPTVVSAGASGAIFGLFGALVAFFWQHREKFPLGFLKLHAKILVIFILYGIVFGALMQGVDNAAHIGGLITGFVVGLALLPVVPGELSYSTRDTLVTAALHVCLLGFLAADCKSIAVNGAVIGDAAYQQAVELLQKQRPARAMPYLNQAAALMPQVASVRRDRARALDQLGRRHEALTDCNEAIKLEPNNKTGFMVRAAILHNTGDEAGCINDLSTVVKIDPNEAMAYNNRAWSYDAMGDYNHALADSDKAISLDRNNATFYDTRAVALRMANRCEAALKDLSKAKMLKRTDGAYYFHSAQVYDKLGRAQLAAQERKRAETFGYQPEAWETKND
ncbi:MAG TPA: rhomboid family intramembrane serine protease [Planktothrix sp.]|jgi:rhomboid protease GluP